MPKGNPELFYRTVQFWEDSCPPPVFVALTAGGFRWFGEAQDYIGSLTEGGIRKNMTLIYELMHEIMVVLPLHADG